MKIEAAAIVQGMLWGITGVLAAFRVPVPDIVSHLLVALHGLPDLVRAADDGAWDQEDLDAMRKVQAAALDQIPGVPTQHAQDIARGLVAVIDLIRADIMNQAPVQIVRRAKARALLQAVKAEKAQLVKEINLGNLGK